METNPKDWLDAAERLFNQAMGYGVVLASVSGFIWGLFQAGIFEKEMLSGYAFDASRLICALSLGLLFVGFSAWVLRFTISVCAAPFQWWKEQQIAKSDQKRLLQNVRMMRPESRLILYFFMNQEEGRFKSPGTSTYLDELITATAIDTEDDWASPHNAGNLCRVSPSLMTNEAKKEVFRLVTRDYPTFTTDRNQVLADLRRKIQNSRFEL